MPVKAEDAEKEFRAFLRDRGTPFETLGAEDGLNAMISFYREVRVTRLRFEKDEDMLLFQPFSDSSTVDSQSATQKSRLRAGVKPPPERNEFEMGLNARA
jgi:hypothetical protein